MRRHNSGTGQPRPRTRDPWQRVAVFFQTDMCLVLSPVNGWRLQPLQRFAEGHPGESSHQVELQRPHSQTAAAEFGRVADGKAVPGGR